MPKNTKHGIFIAASLDGPIEHGKRFKRTSDFPPQFRRFRVLEKLERINRPMSAVKFN